MFVWPHGIRFDRDGNLWVTDGRADKGNGQMVYKMSTDGSKVLMTLGTRGVSGDGPHAFNGVADVAIAPNGDIFVADGHVAQPHREVQQGRPVHQGVGQEGQRTLANSTCRIRWSSTHAGGFLLPID